jgi:hypothetical protein
MTECTKAVIHLDSTEDKAKENPIHRIPKIGSVREQVIPNYPRNDKTRVRVLPRLAIQLARKDRSQPLDQTLSLDLSWLYEWSAVAYSLRFKAAPLTGYAIVLIE